MWRKVLHIVSWVILASYLGVSLWYTEMQMDRLTFQQVVIHIADSLDSKFISPVEVAGVLAKQGIRTTGNKLSELNRDQVKNTIKTLSGVKDARVYSTPDGILYIQVWQRTPVMRYINPFTSFYIDSDGKEMALSENYSARVLMVTGLDDRNFLKDSMFRIAKAICEEDFLDALIEEVSIQPDRTLEIIPRVGDHRIFFGDAGDFEWKLTKLKAFYEKGLPNIGWDRYSKIDLRYNNQVVARKWTKQERQSRDSVWSMADTLAAEKIKRKV